VRTRALQKETGGFTEFVPLPFVHPASPIYLQKLARRGPTWRECLLMHAVARIAYRGWVDNIQTSWVKNGFEASRQLLQAGVNDLGGTLMNENISRAAGAQHGQGMTEADFRALVEPLGRRLVQRNTTYEPVLEHHPVSPAPEFASIGLLLPDLHTTASVHDHASPAAPVIVSTRRRLPLAVQP
jgi:2-iminoacetate synthase ThiH